jgi:hypothetical protein
LHKQQSPGVGALPSKDFKENVVTNLKLQFKNETFINGNRLLMNGFQRNRLLPFDSVAHLVLQWSSRSIQVELSDFFEGDAQVPTKSAFCQARSKMSGQAFVQLNSQSCNIFYDQSSFRKWKGFRVLGIDGSTLQLPSHESVIEEFGQHSFGPKADALKSMARISYLYDVYNGLVLDAQMGGFSESEAALCWKHLEHCRSGDMVLFDRYYASYPLIFTLLQRGIDFCFRMKEDWWNVVEKFSGSKKMEDIVVLDLPEKYRGQYPHLPGQVTVRLLKKRGGNGELQVFCTSLLDCKTYSRKSIVNLYHQRWNIEEAYKFIKTRLDVEDWSGKTALSVKQDFFAKTLLLTLCNIMCFNVKPQTKPKLRVRGNRPAIINRTYAMHQLKKSLYTWCAGSVCQQQIELFQWEVACKPEFSRRGQSVPRNKKPFVKFAMSYKSV